MPQSIKMFFGIIYFSLFNLFFITAFLSITNFLHTSDTTASCVSLGINFFNCGISLSSFLDDKNASFLQLTKSGSPKIKRPIRFLCGFSTAFTLLNQTGFNGNIDYLRCNPSPFLC